MARKNEFADVGADNTVRIDVSELQDTIENRAAAIAASRALDVEDEHVPNDADEIRALSELDGSGDVRWNIHRTLPAATAGWVGVLSTAELSLERLAQEYGVGRYRIKGTRPNGQIAGQRTVSISNVPKNLLNPTPTPPAHSPLDDWLKLQAERDEKRSSEMRAWAALLIPAFAPVVAALIGGNKGPTLAELTATMVNMKELNGSKNTQLDDLVKMFALFRDISGDKAETGSNWMDLVRDGVKELGPAVLSIAAAKTGQGSASQPTNPATPPAPIAPQTPTIPPTPSVPDASTGNPMLALLSWLKTQLAALTHQASLNKDPSLYAEVVLDNLPPGVNPQLLLDILAKDDWWQTLCQFYPQVQAYPPWFAECRDNLLQGLREMVTPPPPAKPTPGKRGPASPLAMPQDNDSDDYNG